MSERDELAERLAQQLEEEVIPRLRKFFGIPVVVHREEEDANSSIVGVILGAEVLEPAGRLRFPRLRIDLTDGEVVLPFTFVDFQREHVVFWDHQRIYPPALERGEERPFVNPLPRWKPFIGWVIQETEVVSSGGLPLTAPTDDRPLSARIGELVRLVRNAAGSSRVETATTYAFFTQGNVAQVGLPAEVTNPKVISRVVVLVYPLGQTVLTVLQVQLTPQLPGTQFPELPLGYEIVGSDTEPVFLRRYLWPQEWQDQEELDNILAEFDGQANKLYVLHCQDYED